MTHTHYDVVVVGSGSGNTVLDESFADRRVAVVERSAFGGTCLNVGCIPTKMFVHPADLVRDARHGPALGARTRADGADWVAVRDRVFGRIDAISEAGLEYREGPRQPNVDVHLGTAVFTGPRRLRITTADGETEVTADDVVLAAGSRPVLPAIPGLDEVHHHTSDTVMRLDALPERVGIIGGGYVGAEFAHVFSSYGSAVTHVHRGKALLDHLDPDVSRVFTVEAERQWDVRLGTQVASVEPTGDGVRMHLDDGSATEVDVLLLATGRRPNSDLLGVEAGGVEVDDDGLVVVDEHQRTTAPGVWALGDLSSRDQLKHVANQDARVVRHNLLHPEAMVASRHGAVPRAVFSSPQVASVGLTEEEARARGHHAVSASYEYGGTAYGWALEDTTHLCKLIGDRATGMLVGAHLVGPMASVLVQPLVQAMSFGQPVAGLARGQYWIHPALTEVVENALLALESVLT